MPSVSTTQSIWRSLGGDTTRQATAGGIVLNIPFSFTMPSTVTSASILVAPSSSTAPSNYITLPNTAIILAVNYRVTAPTFSTTGPTWNMGIIGWYPAIPGQTLQGTQTGTGSTSALVAGAAVGATTVAASGVITLASATVGASLGAPLGTSYPYWQITGGTANAGSGVTVFPVVSGWIQYLVTDPYQGAQSGYLTGTALN